MTLGPGSLHISVPAGGKSSIYMAYGLEKSYQNSQQPLQDTREKHFQSQRFIQLDPAVKMLNENPLSLLEVL